MDKRKINLFERDGGNQYADIPETPRMDGMFTYSLLSEEITIFLKVCDQEGNEKTVSRCFDDLQDLQAYLDNVKHNYQESKVKHLPTPPKPMPDENEELFYNPLK